MTHSLKEFLTLSFADYTAIYTSSVSLLGLIPLITEDLHRLAERLAANKLPLNEQKSKYIIYFIKGFTYILL